MARTNPEIRIHVEGRDVRIITAAVQIIGTTDWFGILTPEGVHVMEVLETMLSPEELAVVRAQIAHPDDRTTKQDELLGRFQNWQLN